MVTELKNCRVCGSDSLNLVVDLGKIFPSGFVKKDTVLPEEAKAPLALVKCEDCGLVQLRDTVDLDQMYRQYWYSSSLNKSMVSSLKDVVIDIESKINIKSDDIVVDIGCNDGTMLGMFPRSSVQIGFDPALNLHKPECRHFVNDYFTESAYWNITDRKAKVVTAIAMFYDLPDPVRFAKSVSSILDDDGLFVVQFTDLLSMFKLCAFDNICNEHLEYYSLQDVVNVLNLADLRVIDVSYNDVNGGSVRVTAAHRGSNYITNEIVIQTLVDEFNYFGGHDFDYFNNKVKFVKEKVQSFFKWAKDRGKTVHLMGASTKGNTLLQYCGVTEADAEFAADVNMDKHGLYIIGTGIQIISQEESLIRHPDYYVVPIWHFKKSLINNKDIQNYLQSGGSLVFPLPYMHVVTSTGEFKI